LIRFLVNESRSELRRTGRNVCPTLGLAKKWGPCLGTRAPSDAFPFVSVVFTPTRGVIHPSFPLRGRWERTLKCDEQAPSPSLVTFLNSSSETRQRFGDSARAEPTGVSPVGLISIALCANYAAEAFASLSQNGPRNSFWNCFVVRPGNVREFARSGAPQERKRKIVAAPPEPKGA
jgi:hypothetical protein